MKEIKLKQIFPVLWDKHYDYGSSRMRFYGLGEDGLLYQAFEREEVLVWVRLNNPLEEPNHE